MKKSRNIFLRLGFYLFLVYNIVSITLFYQVYKLNIVPNKYFVLGLIIYLLLDIIFLYNQFSNKVKNISKNIGKVFLVLLSIAMILPNIYLYRTNKAFDKITDSSNIDISVYSIVVLNDSSIKEIKDLNNKNIGIITIGDTSTQNNVIEQLKKEVTSFNTINYDSYQFFGDALYNSTVDAILISEGARGMFEDNHPNFDEETRKIKSYEFKEIVENIGNDVKVEKEAFNLYITGIDTYGTIATRSRSDVNLLITINPNTHQILMTGIPRDFYIKQTCQNNQLDKLTHTGIFGVGCTINSMEQFLGVDINYYARVNFSSLVNIVDALGGISVYSPLAFTTTGGHLTVKQGYNDFNGEQTLRFVRERYNLPDGDRERSRNQMRALEAMIKKAMSPTIITNYSSILQAVSGSFQTNMSQTEITDFIKAQINDPVTWDIKQSQVSGKGATKWTPANGFNAYVMIPNQACVDNAVKLINKVLNGELVTDADIEQQKELVKKAGY